MTAPATRVIGSQRQGPCQGCLWAHEQGAIPHEQVAPATSFVQQHGKTARLCETCLGHLDGKKNILATYNVRSRTWEPC